VQILQLEIRMAEAGTCLKCGNELISNSTTGICLKCQFLGRQNTQITISRSSVDDVTRRPVRDSHEDIETPTALFDNANSPPLPDASAPESTVRYFGDYELLNEIARGGMGVVYKARQVSLNRLVALKMILAGQFASEADVKRFYVEAEAAANLDHPGIVPIFEVGEHQGHHYFSMGYVQGISLADKIAQSPLPPRESARLLQVITKAISYAHQRGVVHRDLKPANIILDMNGQPKVTDFGLAKRIEVDSSLTGTFQLLGTPSYMAPEQASGKTSEVGTLADVYALGAILYCLLTGRPPFHSANRMDTLRQVLDNDPIPLRQLNPSIPMDLESICMKCLEKNPNRRYRSAIALDKELALYLEGQPITAQPLDSLTLGAKWYQRQPVAASLIAMIPSLLFGGTQCAFFVGGAVAGSRLLLPRQFKSLGGIIATIVIAFVVFGALLGSALFGLFFGVVSSTFVGVIVFVFESISISDLASRQKFQRWYIRIVVAMIVAAGAAITFMNINLATKFAPETLTHRLNDRNGELAAWRSYAAGEAIQRHLAATLATPPLVIFSGILGLAAGILLASAIRRLEEREMEDESAVVMFRALLGLAVVCAVLLGLRMILVEWFVFNTRSEDFPELRLQMTLISEPLIAVTSAPLGALLGIWAPFKRPRIVKQRATSLKA
jgi:serine/threonine protein kinase